MEQAQTGSLAIVGFFSVLAGAAIVLWFLQPMYEPIDAYATNATSNATAERGISYTTSIWENIEYIIVMISGLGLLVLTFYERGGGV